MKTKRSGEAKLTSGEITSMFQWISLVFLKQLSVLVFFFFFSRNTEILLCFLLLAEFECRMFELHNFKIKQDYCFTAVVTKFL